jgi:hypothetical protein
LKSQAEFCDAPLPGVAENAVDGGAEVEAAKADLPRDGGVKSEAAEAVGERSRIR